MLEHWEVMFDELWDKVFPPRSGPFLKGQSPRFPNHKAKLYSFIKEALTHAKEAGEEEGWSAIKLLWDRMGDWQREWQAEKPEERALTIADAVALIEWKMQKAKEAGRKEDRLEVLAKIVALQELYEREDQKPIRIVLGNLWHSLSLTDSPPQDSKE